MNIKTSLPIYSNIFDTRITAFSLL